jgi:hypothetical protein
MILGLLQLIRRRPEEPPTIPLLRHLAMALSVPQLHEPQEILEDILEDRAIYPE